jgi:aspartate/methionine/tyrosine aminotransferase
LHSKNTFKNKKRRINQKEAMTKELNEKLKNIAPQFYEALTDLGKRIFLPEGVVAQGALAKAKAKKINATIGIATTNQGAMYLDGMKEYFPNFNAKDIFPYAAVCGRATLRELWKQKIYQQNPSLEGKNFHNPVVVQGLTHGTNLLAQLFIEKGARVVLPDFCWENYDFIFQTKWEAEISRYSFFSKNKMDLDALQKCLSSASEEKLIVVFNFPHNPTGYAPNKEEMEGIKEILFTVAKQGKKLIVVCDDSYFGLNYDENICPESLFSKIVDLHPNLIAAKLDGVTKECYAWGFRVGFLSLAFHSSSSEEAFAILERKIQGIIRAEVSNISHPLQTIVEQYLSTNKIKQDQEKNHNILQSRYRKLQELLANEKYQQAWDYYPFNSGYFFCMRIKGGGAKKLWRVLLEEYQVGVIYLDDENLRIAYSSVSEEKLEDLLEAIYKAHQSL